jgi:hypothetical protein
VSQFNVLLIRTRFRRYRGRPVPFSCFALPDMFSAMPSKSSRIFIFCAPRLVFGGPEVVSSCFHVLRLRTRFQRYRDCQLPFSCFPLPDSFSAVPRAWGPDLMFCAPELVFGGTEGVRSRFHVLCSSTCFRRCRVRIVMFSYFARPDSFLAFPRATGPVCMFCAPGLIFGGTEGVVSRFHVLPSRTRFQRNGWRRVPFTCFVLPDSFSAVPRATCPVFMSCAP